MLIQSIAFATVLCLGCFAQEVAPPSHPANVLDSIAAPADWELSADPQSAMWQGIPAVTAVKDFFGEDVKLPPTEIRSRWTRKNLYILFSCPYEELNLKPNPDTSEETNKLWQWDVAEAFIGSDYLKPSRYKEFQVSPQGEFVDLDIDRDDPKAQKGIDWDSGMAVKGLIDKEKKIWYGEMRIPFPSVDARAPKVGNELRIGLFRIAGVEPKRKFISWRTTGARTFHVPDQFGSLVLKQAP